MAAEIAVGQRAEPAQLTESQPIGMGDQRRQNAEARLLVQRPVQALVRKPPAFGGISLSGNALLLGAVGFLLFGPDSLISGPVTQELGGQHATARVAGIINGIGSFGAIFSPMLVAWVSERFGWSALFFGFVGVTVMASLLLGLAQALQARRGAPMADSFAT